jgi:hypothetical protein
MVWSLPFWSSNKQKRRRSINRELAQASFLNRGGATSTKIGAVILISDSQGPAAAATLCRVALHAVSAPVIAACMFFRLISRFEAQSSSRFEALCLTQPCLLHLFLHTQSASGLTPIIIEIQASEPSHKTYGADATRMFFGIEAVRVQASAVTFDREQTCCCVAVNGHKIFADMIIASNDVAPEAQTLSHSTRAMTNGHITVIATGSKWTGVEAMLCRCCSWSF